MLFLDVIATPYYLLFGVVGLIALIGIGALIVLTMIIFALFNKSSDKKKADKEEPQP